MSTREERVRLLVQRQRVCGYGSASGLSVRGVKWSENIRAVETVCKSFCRVASHTKIICKLPRNFNS